MPWRYEIMNQPGRWGSTRPPEGMLELYCCWGSQAQCRQYAGVWEPFGEARNETHANRRTKCLQENGLNAVVGEAPVNNKNASAPTYGRACMVNWLFAEGLTGRTPAQ